jgi:hypothetical protein
MLASYDSASWNGTDALLALAPSPEGVEGYVARQTDRGWVVSFGRLNDRRNAFLVAYESIASTLTSAHGGFETVAYAMPKADTGYLLRAALALDIARAEFGAVTRPYNAAVLPTDRGWWVYLMPAPVRAGVWPLGGDMRYLVSPDGRHVLEHRRLHNTIIEFAGSSPDGERMQAAVHSAVLDNVPEDTDVFHVLARTPKVPQYIVTDEFVYRIGVDGVIDLLGRREEVLGR